MGPAQAQDTSVMTGQTGEASTPPTLMDTRLSTGDTASGDVRDNVSYKDNLRVFHLFKSLEMEILTMLLIFNTKSLTPYDSCLEN